MEQAQINPYAPPKAQVDSEQVGGQEAPELWGPETGGALSIVLSVAFGAWIIWRNWIALGEEGRASTARIWFFVSVVFVALIILLPTGGALGFIYLVVWYFAQNRPQIKYVKERFGKDYPHRPWTKVILSTLGLVIVGSFIIGFIGAMLFRHH